MGRINVARFASAVRQITNSSLAATVTLEWQERTGGALDVVTGSLAGGTVTTKTAEARALVHTVSSQMAERFYTELKVGDLILDFDAAQLPDGRDYTGFVVGSVRYSSQKVGPKLAEAWDAQLGNTKLTKTLVLRPMP